MITGNDIIELGHKPGKWFKDAIDYANKNELSGDVLVKYLETFRPFRAFIFGCGISSMGFTHRWQMPPFQGFLF